MIYIFKDIERLNKLVRKPDSEYYNSLEEAIEHLQHDPVRSTIGDTTQCYIYRVTTDYPPAELEPLLNLPQSFRIQYIGDGKDRIGKPRISLVPSSAVTAIADIMTWAIEEKGYGEGSWRKVDSQHYVDAAMRHMLAYMADRKSLDKDSGRNHLHHAITDLAFLVELDRVSNEEEQDVPD